MENERRRLKLNCSGVLFEREEEKCF